VNENWEEVNPERKEKGMPKELHGLWTSHRQHVLARILLLVLGCVVAVSALSRLPAGATAAPGHKQGEHLKPKPGTTLLTYRGHSSRVNGVAWSPSGLRIASGSDDYTVQVWNTSNGGNVLTDETGGLVNAVAWSPDSSRIASASTDETVQVWQAE
jgi:eukaryotic-like serine/threonine-protein kinase